MFYANLPEFTQQATIQRQITQASRDMKEYILRVGRMSSMPAFLKYLNYYCLLKGVMIYVPSRNKITRSTDLRYFFHDVAEWTKEQTADTRYSYPLLYSNAQLESFNLKEVFSIQLIEVVGQIQDVFEDKIPEWSRTTGAIEQNAVSLALKLTPKHRIRVYTRNQHIIVFTTKGISDTYENDYILYRKLWACLPLMRGWHDADSPGYLPEITRLCKELVPADATTFYNLLEQYYNACEELKDLQYSTIIQTFNNITVARQDIIARAISQHANNADDYLKRYAKALEDKRTAELQLLALQQSTEPIEINTIKMLVDKKICYDLNIARVNDGDGTISYRCTAPLLSYDKDAARVVYNKRVPDFESPNLKRIFELLFIDEKVVLSFEQAIDIKLNRGTINARGGVTTLRTDTNTSLPNPHHYHFNCWGSYGPVITKLISEYKLEEVFYQVKAAMGSVNFTDYPVMSQFLTQLDNIAREYNNPKCFLWRDENCTMLHTLEETLQHFKEDAE